MSQDENDLVQRVTAMLVGELTQGGNRDLRAMRLDDLENEVFGLADRVSRCVTEALLREQGTAAGGGPIGTYRCLLWDTRPCPSDWGATNRLSTFYGEFDVYEDIEQERERK